MPSNRRHSKLLKNLEFDGFLFFAVSEESRISYKAARDNVLDKHRWPVTLLVVLGSESRNMNHHEWYCTVAQ